MAPGLSSFFWFVAVIALIPLALWLLKRSPALGGMSAQRGMRQIAALPLSAQQRIVTVEVGQGDSRCWLVLGVTANSINTLHTMVPQDDAPLPMPAPTTAFAQLLSRLQGRNDAR